MITAECPGCLKPLPIEQELCPHCGRPRDESEIERGLDQARRKLLARQRLPRRLAAIGVVLMAVAGASYFAWLNSAPAAAAFNKARADFATEVERVRDPRSHFKVQSDAEPADSAGSLELRATLQTAPASEPAAAAAAEPAAAPLPIATPHPTPPSPYQNSLRVYGVIYDAATLRPVFATLKFAARDGSWSSVSTTDAAGHYLLDVDASRSEQVAVTITPIPGYREGMIEDGSPSLLDRSEESRLKTIAETTDFDLGPAPLRSPSDAHLIEENFVLIPEARK